MPMKADVSLKPAIDEDDVDLIKRDTLGVMTLTKAEIIE